MKKSNKIFLIFVVISILLFTLLSPIMYSNSSEVCAKFKSFSKVKGSKKLNYVFKKNGELCEGRMDITLHTESEINELKNSDCIRIEVSNYWSFFNRVITE